MLRRIRELVGFGVPGEAPNVPVRNLCNAYATSLTAGLVPAVAVAEKFRGGPRSAPMNLTMLRHVDFAAFRRVRPSGLLVETPAAR